MDRNKTVFICWILVFFVSNCKGIKPGCEYAIFTLTCYGPNITDALDNILANTTEINIQNADIKILNTTAFSRTDKLLGLNIENSGVTDLDDGAFAELKFLQTISLKGNKLTLLQKNVFANLTFLRQLGLSENLLVSVEGIFDGLTSLEKLSLRDNQIVSISTDTFQDLTSLHHLELNNNKIKMIQPGAFENLKMLMLLGLGDNPLTSVDNVFPQDMMLQYLNMTACELSTFPSDLPSSLKYLKLTKNKIKRISKSDMKRYKELNALILEDNGLVDIEPGSFTSMTTLTDIFLFVNKLEKIPGPFPAGVKSVHLDNNRIETIPPDTFQNRTTLNILSLRINNISSIHTNAFQNIESIKELHLERNTLTVLHNDMFKYALGLQYLNLNHLTLTAVYQDCFSNLNSLTKLEMSFVRISKDQVHGNIFRNLPMLEDLELKDSPTLADIFVTNLVIERKKIKSITKLNLEDNGIVSLSSDIQTYLPNIQTLALRGNKFHCNANMLWLRTWHIIEPDKFHKFDQVRCHQPRQLQGQRFEDVKISQFYDPTDSQNDTYGADFHITTDDPFQTTDMPNQGVSEGSYYFEYPYYDNEFLYPYDYSPFSTIKGISNHSILETTLLTTFTPIADDNTTQMENLTTNEDTENNITQQTNKPPHLNNNGGNSNGLKTVGIAFGMAFGVIVVMLTGAFLIYKVWQRKRSVAMETGRNQNEGQDYVFIAAQTDRSDKPEPKVHRKLSRTERGSTTSHASEDITNHTDTDMKVYIMDIDA